MKCLLNDPRLFKRSVSFKFVLFVGVLVLVILLSFGSLFITMLSKQAEKEQRAALQASLIRTDVLFSQYLTSVNEYCQQLYAADYIRSIRYKNTLAPTEQVNVSLKVQNSIRVMPFIHSVYIINKEGKCNFHTTNSTIFAENLDEKLPEKLPHQFGTPDPILWNVRTRTDHDQLIPFLSIYMQEAPIGNDYYSGTVVINCDLNWLSKMLFKTAFDDNTLEYFILDRNGKILVNSNTHLPGEELSRIFDMAEPLNEGRQMEEQTVRTHDKNQDFELAAIPSQMAGYKILVLRESKTSLQSAYTILIAISIAVLVLYVLCMSVSYIVGRRMFAPLNNLVDTIQQDTRIHTIDHGQCQGDEFQYLNRYYHQVSDFIEAQKDKDTKSIIVKNLLSGNCVQPLLLEHEIVFDNMQFYAVLIYVCEDSQMESLSDYYQRHAVISEKINEVFQSVGKSSCFEIDLHRILFLISDQDHDEDSHVKFDENTKALIQQLNIYIPARRVIVYASYSPNGRNELLPIYDRIDGVLRTALCLKSIEELSDTVCFMEVNGQNEFRCRIKEQSSRVKETVRQENRTAFLKEINTFLDMLIQTPWTDFVQAIEQLSKEMIAIYPSLERTEKWNDKETEIHKKVKHLHRRDAITDFMLLLYDEITLQHQNMCVNSIMYSIDSAIAYINCNFGDSNLDLSALAKRLNISSSYFGKIFHDRTGKGVSQYITDVRMSKAREYLVHYPEKSMEEIAKDVGFNNSGYFATRFKKEFGIVPSKFRTYWMATEKDKTNEEKSE